MNKVKGNMYPFVGWTHNPIKAMRCPHQCIYCYLLPIMNRFGLDSTLKISEKDLQENLGSNKKIFVGSATDMFADNVSEEWILRVLDQLFSYPTNQYLLQSKNPARFLDFLSHPLFVENTNNVIFCTTIESDMDHNGISKAPSIIERTVAMNTLSEAGFQTMITVEPIMRFTEPERFADMLAAIRPMQVNIGANTARGIKLPEPTKAEVEYLILALKERGVNVFLKSNISRILG